MSQAGDEQQIAALQEEIQRTGARLQRLVATAIGVSAPVAMLAWCYLLLEQHPAASVRTVVGLLLGSALAGLTLGFVLAPLTLAYHRLLRAPLRRKLSALPAPARAEVLLPLRESTSGETRNVVDSLIRELRVDASEVTPAAAPEGRGDEVSPAQARRGAG